MYGQRNGDPVNSTDKALIRVLSGESLATPPLWLMRQAGRYLPEYREVRKDAGSFLELCFTPALAAEVTLQPIRRFGFDAAILFSDILVVPHGLGQEVWFEEGKGPQLAALKEDSDLSALSLAAFHERLDPVYRAIGLIRADLPAKTTLIGFAGAPWTVASYMIEGGSSKDFSRAKTWAYRAPESFQKLIDLLVDATAQYLIRQVEAGADVLQLFDSWAGVWPTDQLRRWCLDPMRQILSRVKEAHPDVPIILFPRGAGLLYRDFATESGADGLALDTTMPLRWSRRHLQDKVALQGNLDPLLLLAGGPVFRDRVATIKEELGKGAFVFNLGHGILPSTPIEHVSELVELVRG